MTRKAVHHNPLRATLRIMDFDTAEQEFAWAVGIFEGEGSIIIGGATGYPTMQLKLGMTDEDVIRKASGILGLRVTGPYISPLANHKPMWRSTKAGPEAHAMLQKMLPHLGARRRSRALEVLAATNTGKRGASK